MSDLFQKLPTESNFYDKLLIVFIALQIFGVIGDALQPIRVFVMVCIPFVFLFFTNNKEISGQYLYEQFLFIFWILYGLITLLWVIIPDESIKEILYLTLNFFAFFTIIYFANRALKPQESIIKGWLLLFILTLPIALYELWFDVHLPISVQDEGLLMQYGTDIFERRFASITYGNLNGYNTLLSFMMPFIFGYLFKALTKLQTIFIWIFAFCLSYIIVMNGSRGAVLCLLVGFVVFAFFFLKGRKSLLIITLIILVSLYLFIYYYNDLFAVILGRLEEQGFSDEGRTEILKNGWDAFINSAMFGIGAGNFMPTMDTIYHLDIIAPHNLFLEVGIQYGLVIFLLFVGMLFRLFLKQKANPNRSAKFIILSSLAMFPLSTIIDSGYILGISIWLFLASLYIIADKQYNLK